MLKFFDSNGQRQNERDDEEKKTVMDEFEGKKEYLQSNGIILVTLCSRNRRDTATAYNLNDMYEY